MTERAEYRYKIDLLGSEITPLALAEAFFGELKLRVHNISFGGASLIFDRETALKVGEVVNISIAIRGRAFPIQIEVKDLRGLRVHCAFVNTSKAFQAALREFLKPKFMGQSLERNLELSGRSDAASLVKGAHTYEAFVGQNETAVFLWTSVDRNLLKLVAASNDLIFEWSTIEGVKTGRRSTKQQKDDEIDWDKSPETTLLHYFADILLAWLDKDWGPPLIDKIFSDETDTSSPIKFPIF